MELPTLLILLIFTAGLFAVPVRLKYAVVAVPVIITMAVSTLAAAEAFHLLPLQAGHTLSLLLPAGPGIDRLSAFFILTVNLTMLTGFLYAGRYMPVYHAARKPLDFSVHYFSLYLLYLSMLAVCIVQQAVHFLIAWEIMSLSSFLLVIFDHQERSTLKTGINYLVQMHVSMFLILGAFLLTYEDPGTFGWEGVASYLSEHRALPVFLLFFAGFGIKAGFIPFHTWLPDAHPAAPSHVSGIMSGVMIKMGIYGILRLLSLIRDDWMAIGLLLLAVSLATGIYGVLQAIVQHDLKKLLAYHSIENIGIIGIGLGMGCLGLATETRWLALLGFGGGLLHVLNHSLFKSLLFYAAGNVYQGTHTRRLDRLGGLGKKMPLTAAFFLLGSLSICGLPPFNGFISEYMLYFGLIDALHSVSLFGSIVLILTLLGLTLVGGLALFCFSKAFGVVFLGVARTDLGKDASEAGITGFIPFFLASLIILAIGLVPVLFVRPVFEISGLVAGLPLPTPGRFENGLVMVSLAGGLLVLFSLALIALRTLVLRGRQQQTGPTWGCGYTAGSPAMQYTATSFADNLSVLAGRTVNVQKDFSPLREEEIFAGPRDFSSHSSELLETWLVSRPFPELRKMLRRIAFLQTGQIRHYILYPFVYLLLIFLLTLLNLL